MVLSKRVHPFRKWKMAKLFSMLISVALASTPAVARPAATSGGDTAAVRAVLGSYQAVRRGDERPAQEG
jgi:hypothetical protein